MSQRQPLTGQRHRVPETAFNRTSTLLPTDSLQQVAADVSELPQSSKAQIHHTHQALLVISPSPIPPSLHHTSAPQMWEYLLIKDTERSFRGKTAGKREERRRGWKSRRRVEGKGGEEKRGEEKSGGKERKESRAEKSRGVCVVSALVLANRVRTQFGSQFVTFTCALHLCPSPVLDGSAPDSSRAGFFPSFSPSCPAHLRLSIRSVSHPTDANAAAPHCLRFCSSASAAIFSLAGRCSQTQPVESRAAPSTCAKNNLKPLMAKS